MIIEGPEAPRNEVGRPLDSGGGWEYAPPEKFEI